MKKKSSLMNYQLISGSRQLVIESRNDLEKILELDDAHWAMTSLNYALLNGNQEFLSFLDFSRNGIIQTIDVRESVRFVLKNLRDLSGFFAHSDVLMLDALAKDNEQAGEIRKAAEQLLTAAAAEVTDRITEAQVTPGAVSALRKGYVNTLIFGEAAPQITASFSELETVLDDYFLACETVRYFGAEDPRLGKLSAPADFQNPAECKALLGTAAAARPTAECILDFHSPLNPLWHDKLLALKSMPELAEYFTGNQLTRENYRKLKAAVAQCRIDAAAILPLSSFDELRKLLSFQKNLLVFLNNFVNCSALFSRTGECLLLAGELVIDGRHFRLTENVKDTAAHKKIAESCNLCILYAELTKGSNGSPVSKIIAAAVTSGNIRNLFIGKRGLFYDPQQTVWEARIIDIVRQPVSLAEALQMPFKRFGEFLTKQADKYFSSQSTAAQQKISGELSAGKIVPRPPAPGQPPALSGSMLLMGGGIGIAAIGSSIAFMVKQLQNVTITSVILILLGILLIFGGPMVMISLVKLFHRNISRFLEANNCAVNRTMNLNAQLGNFFTFRPPMPPGTISINGRRLKFIVPADRKYTIRLLAYLAVAIVCLTLYLCWTYPMI